MCFQILIFIIVKINMQVYAISENKTNFSYGHENEAYNNMKNV